MIVIEFLRGFVAAAFVFLIAHILNISVKGLILLIFLLLIVYYNKELTKLMRSVLVDAFCILSGMFSRVANDNNSSDDTDTDSSLSDYDDGEDDDDNDVKPSIA